MAAEAPADIVAFGSDRLDVLDPDGVAAVLRTLCPSAVVNTAAVSNVDVAEREPARAYAVNATAAGRVAEACAALGIPLIHISTDYVFGADTDKPWTEADPPSPINIYGSSKAEGEQRVLAAGAAMHVVRVAWLFGDRNDFISQILRRGDEIVRVAGDQIGSPTPISEAARRIVVLARRLASNDLKLPSILHLAGAPAASRFDWVEAALDGLRASGRPVPHVISASMTDFTTFAPRPCYSALDSSISAKLFGSAIDWRLTACAHTTFTD